MVVLRELALFEGRVVLRIFGPVKEVAGLRGLAAGVGKFYSYVR